MQNVHASHARIIVRPRRVIAAFALSALAAGMAESGDPLPSWNDAPAKTAIVDFVARVTVFGGPDFVPATDRIATFDNDGTLWPEHPLVQVEFVQARLRALAARDPGLARRQPFKAALEGDLDHLAHAGERAVMELLAATHGHMAQEAFEAEARAFFRTARHPRYGVPYTRLAYRPMVELLQYLRASGFSTFVCSGGGVDFMRIVSHEMYGILPHQVIGSSLEKTFVEKDGRWVLWRGARPQAVNDKEGKPVNIALHVGGRPLLAAGNVRSGGDVAMLRYSQGRPGPSLQLLIDHDDAARELAYQEKDGASLRAAREAGWTVVSMKDDWRTMFGSDASAAPGR